MPSPDYEMTGFPLDMKRAKRFVEDLDEPENEEPSVTDDNESEAP